MHLGLLQTPHGNSGAETARHRQLAVKPGSTEEILDKERALSSPYTNHNQTISDTAHTLIFPLKSHNTTDSKSLPSILATKSLNPVFRTKIISTCYTTFGR